MVIVLEKVISWALSSGAAQLSQKRVSAGFSNWHLGHLTAISDPFYQVWLKITLPTSSAATFIQ